MFSWFVLGLWTEGVILQSPVYDMQYHMRWIIIVVDVVIDIGTRVFSLTGFQGYYSFFSLFSPKGEQTWIEFISLSHGIFA